MGMSASRTRRDSVSSGSSPRSSPTPSNSRAGIHELSPVTHPRGRSGVRQYDRQSVPAQDREVERRSQRRVDLSCRALRCWSPGMTRLPSWNTTSLGKTSSAKRDVQTTTSNATRPVNRRALRRERAKDSLATSATAITSHALSGGSVPGRVVIRVDALFAPPGGAATAAE